MTTARNILLISILVGLVVIAYIMYMQRNQGKSNGSNNNNPNKVVALPQYHREQTLPAELVGMSDEQLQTLMNEKYQKPLEYTDTTALLATPNPDPLLFDKDVRNPLTFNYTRNVTGPWKQPNQEGGDYLRGDLLVAPRQGEWEDKWFSSRYGPNNTVKGAFTEYFNLNTWGTEATYT
jgi:hypothetical protein